jgi:plasmid stability protein
MASLTIRNLDDDLKGRLRVRAAQRRRSMEEEVRQILRAALSRDAPEESDLGQAIQRRFKRLGGVKLALPKRDPIRKPPSLGS